MTYTANRSKLLVSVRTADEAAEALTGGASVIDVKEPNRGSLGAADYETIVEVVQRVAGATPVSAALGELRHPIRTPPAGLSFVKWGLSGLASQDWQREFEAARQSVQPRPVVVAYADWRQAESPLLSDVCEYALRTRTNLLIDTFNKQHSGDLLDFVDIDALRSLAQHCRSTGIMLALAGSLTAMSIVKLAPIEPDLFAVRGAACEGGRDGRVDARIVRDLVKVTTSES